MKNIFSAIFASLICVISFAQNVTFKEWEQEGATSIGLEEARSIAVSFDKREDALTNSKGRFFIPLDEGWSKLEKAQNIDGRVTSNTFTVPKSWVGRDIFLHIGKGDRSYYISVNGNVLGYVEDSKTTAQFKVGNFLHLDAENRVDILYIDSSTGLSLEKASKEVNLNKDIYLFAQPKVNIRDFKIDALLDDSLKNGILEVEIAVNNGYNVLSEVNVGYDIVNSENEIITYNNRDMIIPARGLDTLRLSRIVKGVKAWSPETPYLYTIIFRVKHEGRMVEYIPFKIGFKSIDIDGNTLSLNGKRCSLKVDVVSNPDVLTTNHIKELKAKGVNAITYTKQPKTNNIYNLCDSIGMILIDQINIGAQKKTSDRKIGGTTANNPSYLDVYIERIERRYFEKRNHTSIAIWSLGEGVGNGFNMYRGYLKMKDLDTKRPVLNKGAGGEWNSDKVTIF